MPDRPGFGDRPGFDRVGFGDGAAELQDIVDDVSGLLGSPAVLEDTSFALIAYSSQGVDVDPVRAATILGKTATPAVRAWFEERGIATATGPVRVPGDPDRGIAARICLPARSQGMTHGYLWVLEPVAGFAPDRLALAEPLAKQAGGLLASRRRTVDEHQRLIGELLSGDQAAASAARAALAARGDLPATGPLAVIVVRARASQSGARLQPGSAAHPAPGPESASGAKPSSGAELASATPAAQSGSAEVGASRLVGEFVIAADDPADPLGAALRRASRVGDGRAGIGTPRTDVRELAVARQEADCAARVALGRPRLGPVLRWSELGLYQVAGQGAAAVEALIAGTPAALLRSRADAELLRTALVYLDHAGNAARTAAALSVHRQTLYYRLEKVEQFCGVDLDDGEARLQLHLGLVLAEVVPYLR
ncbi:MAG TPA: helix-turn-helix domain-containing protein [Kineosporiaceae bacterium]|nr:helix-turn-helix domain-containing protein [Kineosporiaceae bacterium]